MAKKPLTVRQLIAALSKVENQDMLVGVDVPDPDDIFDHWAHVTSAGQQQEGDDAYFSLGVDPQGELPQYLKRSYNADSKRIEAFDEFLNGLRTLLMGVKSMEEGMHELRVHLSHAERKARRAVNK